MAATASAMPPRPPRMRRGRSVVLRVSWRGYLTLLKEVGDDTARLTYDNGYLEIEMPSDLHERLTRLIGAMAEAALTFANVDYQPLGSTTWKRRKPLKGIEADECFYISSLPAIQGRATIDLKRDPPPDLAVETEVTRPVLNKTKVYAAIGVPELWRVAESGQVRLYRLNAERVYEPIERSSAIPRLDAATLTLHAGRLQPLGPLVHSQVLREFRQWLATPPAAGDAPIPTPMRGPHV
ncbi:MAG: hypothetical protein JWO31_1183 [Phycisphaerales bacterium]|nr:hypothetical protein [Phycisphaerales bacterium]